MNSIYLIDKQTHLLNIHNQFMDIEHNKKHSYLDEYKILKTLGAGYHAQVKLGEDEHGNLVAIKKYKKQTATLQTLKHQLSIMKVLDHENLVKLISVRENAIYKKQDQTSYNCFAIVLEYVGGGELFDFVAETGKFSQKVTRTYFHQMMNGLHYLHQKGFAHRDIKPQNILLSHIFILKLADFGFSAALKGKDGSGILRTKLGTEGYMAPQIPGKKYEGKSVDIFASGVILFIMYAGNPPFEKATPTDPYYKLIKQNKQDIFWKAHSRKRTANFFSDSFKDLFIRMVAFEPSQRMKIQEIAHHKWVKDAICSHSEIKDQFSLRQKKLDHILELRRIDQQKQKQQKLNAVSTQGSSHRGQTQIYEQFISIYNKEYHIHRNLPTLQVTSNDDITLKDNPTLSLSLLKQFLSSQQIRLTDNEQELIGDDTDVLKVSQIQDDSVNKLSVTYSYTYDVDGILFDEKVVIEILVGINREKDLVLHLERVEGNLLYFKKIVHSIRRGCYAM